MSWTQLELAMAAWSPHLDDVLDVAALLGARVEWHRTWNGRWVVELQDPWGGCPQGCGHSLDEACRHLLTTRPFTELAETEVEVMAKRWQETGS